MKTAVISGGNSGIGKATAIALAKKQFRLIVHGRDPDKTVRAVEEIKQISGNNAVEGICCDISELAGMRKLADAIKGKPTSIEALVLSSGVILPSQVFTADGLEAGFAIQYLSRFALTQMLMPELTAGKARIVMVGAPVIWGAKIYFENIALRNNFTMVRAMAQEMFANHLLVQEFAKRNPCKEVVMNMANPGYVKTDIARHSNILFRIGLKFIGTSPDEAAGNFGYLAAHEDVSFSGYFLKKPGRPDVKEKINYDAVVSERLWNMSMELIKPVF